jgi:RNA polymerase sigma-70 factor (ECF subfamily)
MVGISTQFALREAAVTRDDRFTALVRGQARFVFRVAYSILRNVQDADDIVQETFFKLYRSSAWERIADEKAFLARVTWRLAVGQLRKVPGNTPPGDPPWAGRNPEQAVIDSDWNSLLCRLIDALPEELRQPLALSSFEELKSPEIARAMGIPEGTVRTRLMRARQILKQKLGALGAGHHEKQRSR